MQFLYMKLLAQWLQVYSTGSDGAATLERTARPASSFLPFHSAHLRAACLCIKIIMLFSITAILFSRFLQQPLSCPFTQPIWGAQLPASRLSRCGLWSKMAYQGLFSVNHTHILLKSSRIEKLNLRSNVIFVGNIKWLYGICLKIQQHNQHLNSRAIQCRAAIHIGRSMHWKQPVFVSG